MLTIQHEIPSKGEDKPLQQRIGNIYMLFVLLSPKSLTNILSVWITSKVRHHTWFANLNPARNKYGKIRLRIDFRDLNPSWNKNNYLLPSSDAMLRTTLETMILSSLEGLLECH